MTTDEAVKIFSEIDAGPPLMRAKMWAALIGKTVDWTATFFSGEMERGRRAFVALRHEASDKMLLTTVSLDKHPWLLTCQRGETVRVQGQISKVEPLSIVLKAVELARMSGSSAESLKQEVRTHG